jgi:hypothetical protein
MSALDRHVVLFSRHLISFDLSLLHLQAIDQHYSSPRSQPNEPLRDLLRRLTMKDGLGVLNVISLDADSTFGKECMLIPSYHPGSVRWGGIKKAKAQRLIVMVFSTLSPPLPRY